MRIFFWKYWKGWYITPKKGGERKRGEGKERTRKRRRRRRRRQREPITFYSLNSLGLSYFLYLLSELTQPQNCIIGRASQRFVKPSEWNAPRQTIVHSSYCVLWTFPQGKGKDIHCFKGWILRNRKPLKEDKRRLQMQIPSMWPDGSA